MAERLEKSTRAWQGRGFDSTPRPVECAFSLRGGRFRGKIKRMRGPLGQIIMGSNKEAVVAEKHFSAHFGQKVLIGYSDVIHSDQFSTWEGFKSKVAEEWARQWDRIATADWSRAFLLLISNLRHSSVTALFLLAGLSLSIRHCLALPCRGWIFQPSNNPPPCSPLLIQRFQPCVSVLVLLADLSPPIRSVSYSF